MRPRLKSVGLAMLVCSAAICWQKGYANALDSSTLNGRSPAQAQSSPSGKVRTSAVDLRATSDRFLTSFKLLNSTSATSKSINSKSLIAAEQATDPRKAEADRLLQQGIQQYQISQFEAALQSWQQALRIYQEIKDRLGEGNALGNLGIAYDSLGNYGKAIEYQEQSLAILREIKDRLGEGKSLGNLGNAYDSLGNYGKAIEYHEQSLAILREIKDRWGEGAALGNLGIAYRALGNYGKAIEYQEQRLVIAREIKDRLGEGQSLGNLGSAYDALGNYGKAIEYHEQSLAIAREIKDRLGEGRSLNNLGNALFKSGNLTGAAKTLMDGITTWELLRQTGAGNDANKVSIFEEQARTYRSLQRVLVAQNKPNAALGIAERGRGRAFVELLAQRLGEKQLAVSG